MNFLSPLRMPDPGVAEAAILNAPFVDGGWNRAVESIAEATRSSSAHLLGIGGPDFFVVNVVSGPLADYPHHLADPNLHGRCNWRVQTVTAAMAIQHEAHYEEYRRWHDTEAYDERIDEIDAPYGCQSAIQLDSEGMLGICVLRSRRDGPTTAEAFARFAGLREVLARSVTVQVALDGEAADFMLGDVSRSDGATYLLDRHGAVVAQTDPGAELRTAIGPFRDGTIRLVLRDPADDRAFQSSLAALYTHDRRAAGSPLVRRVAIGGGGEACRPRWIVTVSRLPIEDRALGFAPYAAVTVKPA